MLQLTITGNVLRERVVGRPQRTLGVTRFVPPPEARKFDNRPPGPTIKDCLIAFSDHHAIQFVTFEVRRIVRSTEYAASSS
jgi:hypothetical protein